MVITGGFQEAAGGVRIRKRGLVIGRGGARSTLVAAVGLRDCDHVGEFHDAFLDALQLVAAARQHQEKEEIDHAGDRDLRLPDADRLDKHDVEAGCLAKKNGFAGGAGNAAERARRRARGG